MLFFKSRKRKRTANKWLELKLTYDDYKFSEKMVAFLTETLYLDPKPLDVVYRSTTALTVYHGSITTLFKAIDKLVEHLEKNIPMGVWWSTEQTLSRVEVSLDDFLDDRSGATESVRAILTEIKERTDYLQHLTGEGTPPYLERIQFDLVQVVTSLIKPSL